MNRDEKRMIEDMASIICKETSNKGLCEKCEFKKHEQFGFTYQCRKFDDAEALYNANYRRIADDEIVVKKSEYDILLKDYALTYDNAYQWGLKVGEEKTAIEILQIIKDEYEYIEHISDLERIIAKKYGIEMEG